jgi:hypothetical protein
MAALEDDETEAERLLSALNDDQRRCAHINNERRL